MNHCAFPSEACEGQLEFGSLAGDLAGECVDDPALSTTSATSTGSGSEDGGGTLTGPDGGGGTTQAVDDAAASSDSGGTTTGQPPSTDSTSTGGLPQVDFVASYASCAYAGMGMSRIDPDPSGCAMISGEDAMTVRADSERNDATRGYLIFELGAGFTAEDVAEVHLHLWTPSGSAQTGEIHETLPFTEASLAGALPLGLGAVSGEQGPAEPNEEVVWVLPNDVVGANKTMLYFAIQKRMPERVDYDTHTGAHPPRLVLTLE